MRLMKSAAVALQFMFNAFVDGINYSVLQVRSILEPSDSLEVQEATMTSAQWSTVILLLYQRNKNNAAKLWQDSEMTR